MSEQDPDLGFQVRDRRRRSDEPAAPPPEAKTAGAERAAGGREEPPGAAERGPRGREAATPPAERPGEVAALHEAGRSPVTEPNLVGLFMMLASIAVAALEGVEDTVTGEVHADPHQAAEMIDLLMLLRRKTEGHRTAEETEALDGLIYDLQLRYVQATTRAG